MDFKQCVMNELQVCWEGKSSWEKTIEWRWLLFESGEQRIYLSDFLAMPIKLLITHTHTHLYIRLFAFAVEVVWYVAWFELNDFITVKSMVK